MALNRKNKPAGYKKLNGGGWISKHNRLAIYIRDGFCCMYCGRDLRRADASGLTLDHLVCRVNGGSDDSTNLITACRSCNSQRQDKAWRQYATGGAIERIRRHVRRKLNVLLAKSIIAGTAGDPRVESLRY